MTQLATERQKAAHELDTIAESIHTTLCCCGAKLRVQIIAHLACRSMTVSALAAELALDHTLVSKYLKTLGEGGLTTMRKEKTLHHFSLSPAVQLRDAGDLLEVRLPVPGGLYVVLPIPRRLLSQLHPESGLSEDGARLPLQTDSLQSNSNPPLADYGKAVEVPARICTRIGTSARSEARAPPRHGQ